MKQNKDYCAWLPYFLAGDLNEQDQLQFQKHLDECLDCTQAYDHMSMALDQYRQSSRAVLPKDGLQRLQRALPRPEQAPGRRIFPLRYATAAILALVFFASGFWTGRNSADQPLQAALHLPLEIDHEREFPDLILPSFTVALAESIPRVFSH